MKAAPRQAPRLVVGGDIDIPRRGSLSFPLKAFKPRRLEATPLSMQIIYRLALRNIGSGAA
jgi:hypothetical protein